MPLTLTTPVAGATVVSRDFGLITIDPRTGIVNLSVLDLDAQGNVVAQNLHQIGAARAKAYLAANLPSLWAAYQAEVAGNTGTVT